MECFWFDIMIVLEQSKQQLRAQHTHSVHISLKHALDCIVHLSAFFQSVQLYGNLFLDTPSESKRNMLSQCLWSRSFQALISFQRLQQSDIWICKRRPAMRWHPFKMMQGDKAMLLWMFSDMHLLLTIECTQKLVGFCWKSMELLGSAENDCEEPDAPFAPGRNV